MKKYMISLVLALFGTAATASLNSDLCKGLVLEEVFPASAEETTIICKRRFVIGYSTSRHAPLWVAQKLTAADLSADGVRRRDNFRPDPDLSTSQQSTVKEFVGSGYDRGHMAPFEDMDDTVESADESFVLTNIVPQHPALNRGAWRTVESSARKLALQHGVVYTITGTAFSCSPKMLSAGTHVPVAVWKAILIPSTGGILIFYMTNDRANKTAASTIYSDLIKIDELKRLVPGLTLHPKEAQFKHMRDY
jgi:endonuclease G